MRTDTTQAFQLTAIAAALCAAFSPAYAQDASVAEHARPDSSVSAGIGNWSNARPQQGIYDGMRKGGGFGLFDVDISKRDDATGTWFNLNGRDLGLETREFRAEWLRQGDIGVSLEYGRTPRITPLTINTSLQGIGTTNQQVSGVGAANAQPFGQVTLGTKRDMTQLGFFKNLAPGLDFKASFKNEDKNGARPWGRGGAAEFATEPIDSTTRQFETTLEYVTRTFQLAGGYYYSSYKNAFGLVDTRERGGAAATQYVISLPLDNQAHQWHANGGYNFSSATRATFKVAYTKATQNEALPTSSYPGVAILAGSPTRLNGRLDTTLVQGGITSRVTSRFSIAANLRYHANVEKTPQARFVATGAGAPNCAVATVTCVDNTPLSFKTTTGKLEGTYRLPMGFSLIGGIDQVNQDRNIPFGSTRAGLDQQRYVPFRSKLDETTYRVQVRRSMTETVNGSLAYLHSKRTGSSYSATNEVQSDGINPIHIADRTRDKWRASVDWTPVDRLGITFNVEDSRDRYSASRPYGLRDGDGELYSVDVSYAVSESWKVTGWYSYDKTRALQYNQRSPNGGATDTRMEDRLSDTGNSLGLGLHGQPHERFKLGADLQWTRNVSSYKQNITVLGASAAYPAGTGGPLPDIHNNLTRVKMFGTWAIDKTSDIRFDLIHEKWRTDDWSWTFANGTAFTYGTTTDGTTISQNRRQTSTYVGGRYIYKFQ